MATETAESPPVWIAACGYFTRNRKRIKKVRNRWGGKGFRCPTCRGDASQTTETINAEAIAACDAEQPGFAEFCTDHPETCFAALGGFQAVLEEQLRRNGRQVTRQTEENEPT